MQQVLRDLIANVLGKTNHGLHQSGDSSQIQLHQAQLSQDALTGHQLGSQTNQEAQHCQTTVPVFSELGETEFCLLLFSLDANLFCFKGVWNCFVPVNIC